MDLEDFNTDNIDRYGHCVVCHKNMITKRVVDNQVVEMFTPDHGHTEFLLSNGSKMQVCMCMKCRDNIDLSKTSIQGMIMKAVQKGWELETKALVADEKLPEWTEEHRQKYLNEMKKLDIDCHSESLDKSVVENRQKEILGVK